VPEPIKDKLRSLSSNITIRKQSRKGACGWLFFGENRINRQKIAIKFYDWGGDTSHAEPQNLAAIKSENVISILDAAFVNTDYAYFLTPYCEKGDLDEEICSGVQGNSRAVKLTRDVLSGLSFLHTAKLLHRDLKPQNILIDDRGRAIIGDFGSVKKIPDGSNSVPGSGHSLIYRPPESVKNGQYGITGDIYQIGLLFFQLLGGHFPYEESAWLTQKQLAKYHATEDCIDKQLFATDCIKKRIVASTVADTSTLPPWVCLPLIRTITKACNKEPRKRYSTCNEFLAHINAIRNEIHDWQIVAGLPTRFGTPNYRIQFDKKHSIHYVEKDKDSGWRKDNTFTNTDMPNLVREIETRV
jgi:serine/threonine protein kinase